MDLVTDKFNLMFGDCLARLRDLPDASVDMVLCDPPYGTIKTIQGGAWGTEWDDVIDFEKMWAELSRVCRPGAAVVLFSQEPFTTNLINSATPSIPFTYRAIWLKNSFGNALLAKIALVNYYEDICIFRRDNPRHDYQLSHPLRDYARDLLWAIGSSRAEDIRTLGGRIDHFFRFASPQFSLCTEETYRDLIEAYPHVKAWTGLREFEDIQREELTERARINSEGPQTIFNLPEGARSKSNVFKYAKDPEKLHPTQKPVALLRDLVEVYSNPGDHVLDFTMGSGSTGVACLQSGRRFTGIELTPRYYGVACERVALTY